MNFPLSEDHGILSYLFRKHAGNIDWYINFSHTCGYVQDLSPKNLFDNNISSFWIAENFAPENNSVTFCLINHLVKITGYKLTTPNVTQTLAYPQKWGFLALNSYNESNEEEIIVEHEMGEFDSFSTNYSRGIHTCFRYINHAYSELGEGFRSRVSGIDLFGTLYIVGCPTVRQLYSLFFHPYILIFQQTMIQ